MKVIYHPKAELELIEAARFYKLMVPNLGTEFLDEVDEAISDILSAPTRWRIIEVDIRRYVLRRFPYAVYFRTLPDHLRILAIKHHSRHPDYWRGRIN